MLTALIGAFVCILVVALHPPRDRANFVLGAVVGSVVGIALWAFVLGPWILP